MNKRMLYIKGNFKNFICYIGISLLALIIIISSTIIYNNNVISSADGATTSLNRFYLEEIAKRNVHEITTALDNNIKYSKRAINEIKESDLESKESLNSYLAMIEKLYDLDFFAVYDNEGEIYTLNNTILNVSNEYYLKKINDNLKLYITQISESRALVLIVSKMDELSFQNKKLVSYISGIDIENIVSSLVSYNDKNKVICSLFNSSDGTCIVETEGSIEEGKSLFQLMDDAFFSDEFTKEEFLNDWNNFNEGYTYYKGPLGYTYLYYMPVPNTNWMFTIRLRESVINEQITDYNKNMLISTQIQLSIVLACMAILFILAIIQTFKIQKEIHNRKSEKELFDQKTLAHLEQLKLKEILLEEEKKNNRQASILQILSNEYSSVFYVDIIDDIAIPIRLSEFSVFKTGLEINKPYPFKEYYSKYINSLVYESDIDNVLVFSDINYLRKILKDTNMYTYLHKINQNGKELYTHLRIAKVEDDENFRHIIFGFAIVDDYIRKEQKTQLALEEALEKAKNANLAKTTFLNNMSHDIRTPINAIIGFTNLALKEEVSLDIRYYLEKISKSSDYLLTLINEVLDLSRIESGKATINLNKTNLNNLVNTVSDIITGYISEKNLNFNVKKIKIIYPIVLADDLKIRDILVNILSNAVKYTDSLGYINFTIDTQLINEGSELVIFKIEDNGIGMSEEFLSHIFDEYSQEYAVVQSNFKSTGLGMSIAKRYIELMGGSIDVYSKKGIGTKFTVAIPLKLANLEINNDKVISYNKDGLKGINILIAEDNDLNYEIVMLQLEEYELNIIRAKDGNEVLEIFKNSNEGYFDIILMDVMMPKINGYMATKLIRELNRKDSKEIPIIAMTANAFKEDIEEALKSGMNAHISKPLKIEEVIITILKYINK